MPAAGRWFITPHAVRAYIRKVKPGLSWNQALADLIRLSRQAHRVRSLHDGVALYRGPKPHRIRCYVQEEPDGHGPLPALLTVVKGSPQNPQNAKRDAASGSEIMDLDGSIPKRSPETGCIRESSRNTG